MKMVGAKKENRKWEEPKKDDKGKWERPNKTEVKSGQKMKMVGA